MYVRMSVHCYDQDTLPNREHYASEVPLKCSWLPSDCWLQCCVDFSNFCLLALLCACCVMPQCSVFWHHSVLCVGILLTECLGDLAVELKSAVGVVWGGVGPDAEIHSELQQCLLGRSIQTNRDVFYGKRSLFACDTFFLHLFRTIPIC